MSQHDTQEPLSDAQILLGQTLSYCHSRGILISAMSHFEKEIGVNIRSIEDFIVHGTTTKAITVKKNIGNFANVKFDLANNDVFSTENDYVKAAINQVHLEKSDSEIRVSRKVLEILQRKHSRLKGFANSSPQFVPDTLKEVDYSEYIKGFKNNLDTINPDTDQFVDEDLNRLLKISIQKQLYVSKILETLSYRKSGTIVHSFMSDMGKTLLIKGVLKSVIDNNKNYNELFRGVILYDHKNYGAFEGYKPADGGSLESFIFIFNRRFDTNLTSKEELENTLKQKRYLVHCLINYLYFYHSNKNTLKCDTLF